MFRSFQIIFRELVGSLLKSLCCVEVCWKHTSPHRAPRTHTTRYAAASPQITITIFKNFKNFEFSDFNKELTSSLMMICKDRNMLERF